jgi:hypothetical protein
VKEDDIIKQRLFSNNFLRSCETSKLNVLFALLRRTVSDISPLDSALLCPVFDKSLKLN